MKKKQAELLKQFQAQQKAFASSLNTTENNDDDLDSDLDYDLKSNLKQNETYNTKNLSTQQQQPNFKDFDQVSCILCQESVKNSETNPIAVVSFLNLANKPQVRKKKKKKMEEISFFDL